MTSSSLCLTCELRALVRSLDPSLRSWRQQKRFASVMKQKPRPTRMRLADDVSRTGARKGDDVNNPFGGMNRTDPGPRLRDRANLPKQRSPDDPEVDKGKSIKKNKDDRPLFHALKMQTALSPLSYGSRMTLKEKLDKIQEFQELGLRPDILEAIGTQILPYLETLSPTPAQKLAIPALISQKGQFEKSKKAGQENEYDKFLLAAETGSGKTLAYLLPIINSLKINEDAEKAAAAVETEKTAQENAKRNKNQLFQVEPPKLADAEDINADTGRPRVLILLPSSELVDQVGKVSKLMSYGVKYRSAAISASNSPTVIKSRLFNKKGIDVVVSTPHLLSSIAEKEPNILSRVNYIVVDEADSLFDRSFRDITLGLIDRSAPSLKQLVLCSATIPRNLDTFIDKRFPMMKRLVTPKLHSIPRRVQLGVVDIEQVPYQGNRTLACADVIWQLGKSEHDEFGMHHTVKHIIVFCNERTTAEQLGEFLASKGIDATTLTRDTADQRNGDVLESFTAHSRVEGELKEQHKGKDFIPFEKLSDTTAATTKPGSKKLENVKVLVTTDLGSRGIDTLAVRHAILYDVPHTTIDFVHRLGRLGRMNRRGRGIVLVGKKDRKDVVREVREAMYKGQALI